MTAAGHDGHSPGMFERFLHSEVSGSIVLLASTIAALAWANSPWAESYEHLTHTKVSVSWGEHVFSLTLHHWINDGLMVVFFFVVGLEIKREILVGQLSSLRQAILPVSAALGGMVVPAGLFTLLNAGGDGAAGWGVPMATDIAFALGVLALFGKRVPLSLKVFLAALAIADDLGAVMVIACFYTESISFLALGVAAACLVLIRAAAAFGIRRIGAYILLGVGCWVAVLASGVHATVAGVLLAMMVPVRSAIDPRDFLKTTRRSLEELEAAELTQESMLHEPAQLRALNEVYLAADDMRPAGIALENYLHPLQSFLILPLFAFFNAGVRFGGDTTSEAGLPVSLGIVLGLVVGKPLGVALFSWLAVRSGRAELPAGARWAHVVGVGFLGGIGFTMSIFISELAFKGNLAPLVGEAKIGTLLASLVAGVVGSVVLHKTLPRGEDGG